MLQQQTIMASLPKISLFMVVKVEEKPILENDKNKRWVIHKFVQIWIWSIVMPHPPSPSSCFWFWVMSLCAWMVFEKNKS